MSFLLLLVPLVAASFVPQVAVCSGLCQGCYCDQIINGSCYVGGRPSGCIGCVGSCVADNDCQCRAGVRWLGDGEEDNEHL